MSTIVLTGDLLTALMVPGGMVSATRSDPATNPLTALNGTWATYELTDPQTMVTTTLTLVTTGPK